MGPLIIYLNFEGNCRDVMTFYQQCLGGELTLVTFGDMPEMSAQLPEAVKSRIMHASLKSGDAVLMASDTLPGMPGTLTKGTNFSISVQPQSSEEIDRLWAAFSQGGTIQHPLSEAPWGARYGMLTDQFGIQWMFNYETPKS
jgi:PhnB protein